MKLFSKIEKKKKYRFVPGTRAGSRRLRLEEKTRLWVVVGAPRYLDNICHRLITFEATLQQRRSWRITRTAGGLRGFWIVKAVALLESNYIQLVSSAPHPTPCLFLFSTAVFREPSLPPRVLRFLNSGRAKNRSFLGKETRVCLLYRCWSCRLRVLRYESFVTFHQWVELEILFVFYYSIFVMIKLRLKFG